jgi:hypothetical protein
MNPILQNFWSSAERARHGIRSIEDFSPEELALLQAKVAGWVHQPAPQPGRPRPRAPFVMKRRAAAPA